MKNSLTILITGGSSGIGKATAQQLHTQGHRILLVSRNAQVLASTAAEIGPDVQSFPCNLGNAAATRTLAEDIIASLGVPEVVIHCAGAGEWLSLEESDQTHFTDALQAPYLAAAHVAKAFDEAFKARGTGHHIFINSAACYFGIPKALGYTAARWALRGFTQSLYAELRHTSIHVSTIVFAKVDSPYFENNPISEDRIPGIVNKLMRSSSVEEAAEVLYHTVQHPRRLRIHPWQMSIAIRLSRLFPGLFDYLIRKV